MTKKYSKTIKIKKYSWGATALAAAFPSRDVVSIVGSVAGGSRAWSSAEVASVHAQMLLEGTKAHSKKELQLMLDGIGASLSFNALTDRLQFVAKVRPAHVSVLLTIIAECISNPTFPEPELAVMKMHEAANLESESQNTYTQASVALSRLLNKPTHPNYNETTKESIKALKGITAKDMRERHKKVIDKRTLVVSIAGDITPSQVFALVNKHFKSLPQSKLTFLAYSKSTISNAKKVQVDIANKASIDYVAGMVTGVTNGASDYAALLLGIQILGNRSGFSGRLMKTVREEEGLTYGVYAMLSGFTNKTDGYLYIWATFAPQLFEKGKDSIKRQVHKILIEGVTNDEVIKHRQLYEARSRVRISNSGAFASAAHDVVVDKKPLSYLTDFPTKVLKLTAGDVNKALKKYLIEKKLSEAAAGTFK